MKKYIIFLVLAIVLFIIFWNSSKQNYAVEIGESEKFTTEEIKEGVTLAAKKLKSIKGASIIKIYYDEQKANEQVDSYLTDGGGSEKNLKKENVLVLYSDFHTDRRAIEQGLNDNFTYRDWNCILVRKDKNDKWHFVDWGY